MKDKYNQNGNFGIGKMSDGNIKDSIVAGEYQENNKPSNKNNINQETTVIVGFGKNPNYEVNQPLINFIRLALILKVNPDKTQISRTELNRTLRQISGDAYLKIEFFEENYTKVIVKGTVEGVNKIKGLWQDGQSEKINWLFVEDIRFLNDDENDKAVKKSQFIEQMRTQKNLQNRNFSKADFSGAYLPEINLRKANLSNANLNASNLRKAQLGLVNLVGADLSLGNLIEASLVNANLSGANLKWTDLRWAHLDKACLIHANLSGADLNGAILGGANLSGANLKQANLSGANLKGAILSGADLSGADLNGAAFCKTDLRWANLVGAKLNRTDLERINVVGAKFGNNSEILEEDKEKLTNRGAIFEAAPSEILQNVSN